MCNHSCKKHGVLLCAEVECKEFITDAACIAFSKMLDEREAERERKKLNQAS